MSPRTSRTHKERKRFLSILSCLLLSKDSIIIYPFNVVELALVPTVNPVRRMSAAPEAGLGLELAVALLLRHGKEGFFKAVGFVAFHRV